MKPSAGLLDKKLLPIALAQFVGLACGIAGIKLASTLVTPEDYGRYGVFLTFTPLGMWVVHAGLIKFTSRHWAGAVDRPGLWRDIMRTAARYLPWLALSSVAAAFLMSGSRLLGVLPFVFLAAAALSFGTLSQTALQAERRHWSDFSISLGGSVTRTFVPLLLYWLFNGPILALYGGYTLHAVFYGVWALLIAWPGKAPRPMPPAAETPAVAMTAYAGTKFQLLALAGWMLAGLNRWLVAFFFGATAAGHFTLAGNVAVIVPSMLGAVFTQYFQPEFFAMPHATVDERLALLRRVDRVAGIFTALAVTGLILVWLALPRLEGTLIDAKYMPAVAYVLPAGCFFIATTTALFYHQLLLACQRESACLRVDLTFAGALLAGGLVTAAIGPAAFAGWLLVTPVMPWLLNRSLARRLLFRAESSTLATP